MRILLLIYSLAMGGAERVAVTLARHWTESGKKVTIVTFEPVDFDFYVLPPGVERQVIRLFWPLNPSKNLAQKFGNWWRKFLMLRHGLLDLKPNVVVSFMDVTNILAVASLCGSGVPVIVSERTDPRYHFIERKWGWLRRVLYPRAAAVVVQTEAVAGWAREFVPAEKVWVIPNPVREMRGVGEKERRPVVAAMGRLDRQKGFDLLLRAWALVAGRYPGWRLWILGDGPERGNLEGLCAELGLLGQVDFLGRVADPEEVLSGCELFVLSSRYEGFPNALLEAMALGLPVVSFDCPSGPGEIVRDGVDGYLVPLGDVGALAEAMGRLMGDEAGRRRMGERAREVRERFSLERIMGRWEELLEKVGRGS